MTPLPQPLFFRNDAETGPGKRGRRKGNLEGGRKRGGKGGTVGPLFSVTLNLGTVANWLGKHWEKEKKGKKKEPSPRKKKGGEGKTKDATDAFLDATLFLSTGINTAKKKEKRERKRNRKKPLLCTTGEGKGGKGKRHLVRGKEGDSSKKGKKKEEIRGRPSALWEHLFFPFLLVLGSCGRLARKE